MSIDRIISMVIHQIVRRFVGSGINAAFKYGGSKFGSKTSEQGAPATQPSAAPAQSAPAAKPPAARPPAAESKTEPEAEPVTRYAPITDAEREAQLAGEDLTSRAKKTAKLGRRMGRF